MGIKIFSYGVMLLGILIVLLGVMIWKKQKVTLINGRSNIKMKEEDLKKYTESIGKAYIILGLTTVAMLILMQAASDTVHFIGFVIWIFGFIISIVKIIRTQHKYKTGIWK